MSVAAHLKTWFIFHILFTFQWIMSTLLVCFISLLATLFIWPYDRKLYRKVIFWMVYSSWCQFTCIAKYWSNSELTVYVDDPAGMEKFGAEHCLVLMNHKYEIDWLYSWLLADAYNVLGGTKVFVKDVIRYMPLFGWMLTFSESYFLQRDWNKDKENISNNLKYITDEYPENQHITTLLFAEGTRFTEEKKAKCNEFARKRGMQELKHHLIPRTKGFVLVMHGIKGKMPALLDVTLAFRKDAAPPSLYSIIHGYSTKGEMYVRRIKTDDVPLETDEECAEWLQQLYRDKDEVFENFEQNGRFTIGQKLEIPKNYTDLALTLFWFVTITVPFTVYMLWAFVTGTWTAKIVMTSILGLFYVAMKKLMATTEIAKTGSSFGLDTKETKKDT